MRKLKQTILLILSLFILTSNVSAKPKQKTGYINYDDCTLWYPRSDDIKGWLKAGYTDICFRNTFLSNSDELEEYLAKYPDYVVEGFRKYNVTIHIWNDWGTYCWSVTSVENLRTRAEIDQEIKQKEELRKQKQEEEYQATLKEKSQKRAAINDKAKEILSKTKYKNYVLNEIESVQDNNIRFESDLLKNKNAYLIYPFNISTYSNEKGFVSGSDIQHEITYLDDDVKFEILKEAKTRQEFYDKTYNDALALGWYDVLPGLQKAEQQGLLVLVACDNGKVVLLGLIPEK